MLINSGIERCVHVQMSLCCLLPVASFNSLAYKMDGPRIQACENNHLMFKEIHAAFLLSTIGQINHHHHQQQQQTRS